MATPESLITGFLEAIAGWGSTAGKELGKAISNPSNVPIFLSSLVKFSLGPTLAFGFARWSVLRDEKRRDDKEAKAVKTLLRIEIEQNRERLIQRQPWLNQAVIQGNYGLWLFPEPEDNMVNSPKPVSQSMQRKVLDGQLPKLPHVLEAEEIENLLAFYDTMDSIFIASWAPLPSDTGRRVAAMKRIEKIKNFLDRGNPLT